MPVVFCPCGHRLEATDDPTLVRMPRDHNQQAHPHLAFTEQDYQDVLSARVRMSSGRPVGWCHAARWGCTWLPDPPYRGGGRLLIVRKSLGET